MPQEAAPVREKTNAPTIGTIAARMVLLERAAGHLKQQPLADAMDMKLRTLQSKLDATRGITNADLQRAADAVDQRASELAALANQMREAAQ
ncbi:hypothetical protein [Sphingomonas sp. T9W2]|uniref:hypothetical protein n=1 Tax=Sphingomonas sp. T9W2 TaxID=3143183 RepID=UPI0031F51160